MVWIIFNLNSVNSVNSVNTPKLRNQGYFPVSQRSWVQIPYRPSFHYYLSNVHYCEDRFHIHVFNHSSNIWLSYIHNRLKDNKLGRCHNLVTEMGEFSRQAVIFRARWSCYLHILFTSRNWQNSDVEALCLWKNFCSWKKQKQKKDLGIKRGKKKKALRRKISNKVASNQNLSYIEQKWGFLLLMQVPALTHELQQLPRNVILKAVCRFFFLLLSTFWGFSIFATGFSYGVGNLAHYCVVLLNALQNDRDEKTCPPRINFPGKSWSIVIDARRSRCPIGLRFREAR